MNANFLTLASFLTSLGLSVLICKMGRIIPNFPGFGGGCEGDPEKAPPMTPAPCHLSHLWPVTPPELLGGVGEAVAVLMGDMPASEILASLRLASPRALRGA